MLLALLSILRGRIIGSTPHVTRGVRTRDLSYALEGFSSHKELGESIDGPIERWKPNIEVVRATIQFAIGTERLVLYATRALPWPISNLAICKCL